MPASNLARNIPEVQGRVKLLDFAPDLDPITPGILLDCSNLVPTTKGFRTYPALTQYSQNALPSACQGAWFGLQGNTPTLAAGVSNQLYVLLDQVFTSQGLVLTTTTNRWRFDLYGNDLIAVNGVDSPKVKIGGGSFGNLGGTPPVASIVQATDYSVFLIEPNSRKWWSTLSDTVWTPSIATQTVTANLDIGDGNITAAHSLRSGIALYKKRALAFGYFVGPPLYWEFRKISDQIGVPSQEAAANLGDIHYFPGRDDFYSFDGYTLQRLPNNLKEWFFDNLDGTQADKIATRWDEQRSLIFWHFPSVSANPAGSLDRWICYNARTGKWTADTAPAVIDMPVFVPIETGHLTYGVFTKTYPSYGAIPSTLKYGDLQSRPVPISGVIKSLDHALHIFNGEPSLASFTTHDFGDRHNMYQVTRIRPEFTIYPQNGATLEPFNQYNPGTTPVAPSTIQLVGYGIPPYGIGGYGGTGIILSSDGWFNFRNTARLQRFKITGYSEFEISMLEAMIEYAGER